jgi:PAS domain S-box-containing protein
MTDKDTPPGILSNPPGSAADPGQQVENSLLRKSSQEGSSFESSSPAELERILQELQVYQQGLEIQNQKLLQSQKEIDLSRARYFDLYDLAPVGYLTICEAGLIREGNFAAAGLLGVSRQALIQQTFTRFVAAPFQENYSLLCKRLLETRLPQTTELRMLGRKNKPFWAHLEISLAQDASGAPEFRVVLTNIAERKRAEDARSDMENFSTSVIRSMQDGFSVLDLDGVAVDVNPALCAMTGFSKEELVGVEPPHPYWPPEEYERIGQALSQTLKGENKQFELTFMRKNGERFSVSVSPFAVRDRNGETVNFAATVKDITERKQAEERLRDANQKLRLHFEQTPMAVIEWNMDFQVTQWNPAAQTIFGYRPDEALGQHASFIVPEAVRPMVDGIFEALIKRAGGERSRNANISKDGTMILCEWYNTPLIDEHGTVAGVASVVMDITEQTEALELLAWEKSALEAIGSSASLHPVLDQLMLSLEKHLPGAICSVLLLDADGIHLRHGAAPSLPEAYNHLVDGLAIGPAVGSCGTAAFEKRQVIVSDTYTDPLWADYRATTGKYGLRACWSTPIFGRDGTVIGTFAVYSHTPRRPAAHELELIERAVHVVRIAIKRKHAEEEIQSLNASLEKRVEERTAELETANKELEAFTYSVSHDLRAPLRAVDGFSRMVIEDCAADIDADGRRMLGVIRSETQRMGRLIDDLLAFSRLGRLPIELFPVDMRQLVRETFDELAAREPEREFKLDLHRLAIASGSEALIRQVWVNLLSNAVKFTRKREICEIEIGCLPGDDGDTVYYVKDNGSGFDMRHSGKLFGIFQRLHSQEEFPGTGVGLALVERIIHRHGGKIWAESEVGRGAAFYFSLPDQKP